MNTGNEISIKKIFFKTIYIEKKVLLYSVQHSVIMADFVKKHNTLL